MIGIRNRRATDLDVPCHDIAEVERVCNRVHHFLVVLALEDLLHRPLDRARDVVHILR